MKQFSINEQMPKLLEVLPDLDQKQFKADFQAYCAQNPLRTGDAVMQLCIDNTQANKPFPWIKIYDFVVDQWDIQLTAKLEVNSNKFTEKLAAEVNDFWCHANDRLQQAGSNTEAALRLYAAQCFEQASFNNFINVTTVTEQFDYEKGNGIEGFFSFKDAGLKLTQLDNFHFEFDIVKIKTN